MHRQLNNETDAEAEEPEAVLDQVEQRTCPRTCQPRRCRSPADRERGMQPARAAPASSSSAAAPAGWSWPRGWATSSASAAAPVTLIDKTRTHLWKPQLHEIAAGSMDIGAHEVDYLAQAHWHHFRFRVGEMIGLDRERQEVHVAPSSTRRAARSRRGAAFPTTRW